MRIVDIQPVDAPEDEVAAIVAALALYRQSLLEPGDASLNEGRWNRAGRLEALGLTPTRHAIDRGWRI